MKAGHFRFKNVSTGDLNRGRRTESRVLFGYFLHDAKSDNPYSFAGSFEVFQTSNQLTAAAASYKPIKTFPKGSFEVLQTSNQLAADAASYKPIKTSLELFHTFCKAQKV